MALIKDKIEVTRKILDIFICPIYNKDISLVISKGQFI